MSSTVDGRHWARSLLTWAVVSAVLHLPTLLQGLTPFRGDTTQQYLAWFTFGAQHVTEGRFPTWNPFVYAGMPFHTNPEAALFFPFTPLFWAFPFPVALVLLRLLDTLVAGFFFERFLARLDVGWPSSFLGALLFTQSALFTWQFAHVPYINTLGTFPAVLWAAQRLLVQPGLPQSLLLALLWLVHFMGGSPEVFFFCNLLLAAFLVFRLASSWRAWGLTGCLQRGAWMVFAGLVLVGGAAVQWLPTLEFTAHSGRDAGVALTTLQYNLSGGRSLWTLLMPWLAWSLGAPYGSMVIHHNLGVVVGFMGTVAVLLACLAVLSHRAWGLVYFLLAVALMGVVLSRAADAPLLAAIHQVPPLAWFRWPHNFLIPTVMAVCCLSALGMECVLSNPLPSLRRLLFVASVLLALGNGVVDAPWHLPLGAACLAASALTLLPRVRDGGHVLGVPLATVLALGCVVELAAFNHHATPVVDAHYLDFPAEQERIRFLATNSSPHRVLHTEQALFWMDMSRNHPWVGGYLRPGWPQRLPGIPQDWTAQSARVDWLTRGFVRGNPALADQGQLAFPVNHGMVAGYQELGGYDVFRLKRLDDLFTRLQPTSLLSIFDVKYVVSGGPVVHRDLVEVPGDWPGKVYEFLGPATRFFLQTHVEDGLTPEQVLTRMAQPGFGANPVVLVEEVLPGTVRDAVQAREGSAGTVTLVDFSETRVQLDVQANHPCMLVQHDAWYPGWTATVGSEEQRVVRVNYFFRGMFIPAGHHSVVLRYQPRSLHLGAMVSLSTGGLSCLLLLTTWAWRRRKRGGA